MRKKRFIDPWAMERSAQGDSVIHRLNPGVKLAAALVFVLAVVSYPPDAVSSLTPFASVLILIWSVSGAPAQPFLAGMALAAPFAAAIGLFNPLLDVRPVVAPGGWVIAHGWLSFTSIILRTILCVGMMLMLTATTRLNDLTYTLSGWGVPEVFLSILLMIRRYLFLLADEALRMFRALKLRGGFDGPPPWRTTGAMLGQLLVRSYQRAQSVHDAMRARGFSQMTPILDKPPFRLQDALILAGWIGLIMLLRWGDFAYHLGVLLIGG